MTEADPLARGRTAFDDEAWADACSLLAAADREALLEPEDLDRLATAAYLVGADAASVDARTRAHNAFLERGDTRRAARSAFWLAFTMLDQPDQQAQASGWLARVRRLLDDCAGECVEEGLWLCAKAFRQATGGDVAGAHDTFREAARIGARFKYPDLLALARHGEARTLLRMDQKGEGLAMLDEVMVAVTCGEVAPMVAGVVYCSVIGACHELFDLRRAQEWTTALAGWCAAHPDMVPFRGQCLVLRSELLQLHGAWQDALEEARRVSERQAAAARLHETGAACYQEGELHRLRGDLDRAEEAYRRASHAGRKPYPGLALLRLAQGQLDAATTLINRALEEIRPVRTRAQVLRASVEIFLAGRDLSAARRAADELGRLAVAIDAPYLKAANAQASGTVALAEGDARSAVDELRAAWTCWLELGVPYEVATVRALVGLAYRALGDEDGALIEFEAAQEAFERLGAVPDAARIAALLGRTASPDSGALTGRELEVLRLIATGMTNRAIAAELSISEKTVARHVSNIFTKLDLSSRLAATAYAYNHKLL